MDRGAVGRRARDPGLTQPPTRPLVSRSVGPGVLLVQWRWTQQDCEDGHNSHVGRGDGPRGSARTNEKRKATAVRLALTEYLRTQQLRRLADLAGTIDLRLHERGAGASRRVLILPDTSCWIEYFRPGGEAGMRVYAHPLWVTVLPRPRQKGLRVVSLDRAGRTRCENGLDVLPRVRLPDCPPPTAREPAPWPSATAANSPAPPWPAPRPPRAPAARRPGRPPCGTPPTRRRRPAGRRRGRRRPCPRRRRTSRA